MLTAGSLFSGAIDGLGLAASLAGFDIRFHIEYDDWRRKVLEKHAPKYWPNAAQFQDITTVETATLPRTDVLFGGFPCQDVSLAGDRAGLGEGTRSGLWGHFRRLIGDLRPRAVVVENVPGLLTLGGSAVVGDLAALGYVGRWGIISAADAGAPHLRERVFVVAYAQQNGRLESQITAKSRTPEPQRHTGLENPAWSLMECSPESGSAVHRAMADTNIQYENLRRSDSEQLPQQQAVARLRGGSSTTQPRLGRNDDGAAARLDGFAGFPAYQNQAQHDYEPSRLIPPRTSPDRTRRLESLGDAVVWWQAYPIFYYLAEVLSQ